jgi:Stigma-specific protein, Stig1
MSRALVSALHAAFAAIAVAACSTGVLDLLPPGAGGGGSTGSANGGGAASSTGAQSTSTSSAGGAGGASSSSASGTGGNGCVDPNCPCGLQTCLGACVDIKNDPSFCGGCDQPCKHNEACESGQCACLPGFTMCSDGSCHQLASDPDHCGSCTRVCAAAEACDLGQCKQGCSPNSSACPASNSRTACVDLGSGEPFCGQCGVICGPTQVCSGQHCVDFKPATPCDTCPCTAECAAIYPAPVTCCHGVAGTAQPICVHGETCPP